MKNNIIRIIAGECDGEGCNMMVLEIDSDINIIDWANEHDVVNEYGGATPLNLLIDSLDMDQIDELVTFYDDCDSEFGKWYSDLDVEGEIENMDWSHLTHYGDPISTLVEMIRRKEIIFEE
jgi:hypothetical protein